MAVERTALSVIQAALNSMQLVSILQSMVLVCYYGTFDVFIGCGTCGPVVGGRDLPRCIKGGPHVETQWAGTSRTLSTTGLRFDLDLLFGGSSVRLVPV